MIIYELCDTIVNLLNEIDKNKRLQLYMYMSIATSQEMKKR